MSVDVGLSNDGQDGYNELRRVLNDAVLRAAKGKGKERHASGENFENQKICQIPRWQKNIHGLLYQITKKGLEIDRLASLEAQIRELQDVIVYAAGAIIVTEEFIKERDVKDPEKIAEKYSKDIIKDASELISWWK